MCVWYNKQLIYFLLSWMTWDIKSFFSLRHKCHSISGFESTQQTSPPLYPCLDTQRRLWAVRGTPHWTPSWGSWRPASSHRGRLRGRSQPHCLAWAARSRLLHPGTLLTLSPRETPWWRAHRGSSGAFCLPGFKLLQLRNTGSGHWSTCPRGQFGADLKERGLANWAGKPLVMAPQATGTKSEPSHPSFYGLLASIIFFTATLSSCC